MYKLINMINNYNVGINDILKEIKSNINNLDYINFQDEDGNTALHHLLIQDFDTYEILKLLIKIGADVNIKNNYNSTALHVASTNRYDKNIKLLLKAGAEINIKDKFGYTPLLLAVRRGNIYNTKLLLKAGADINIQNHDNKNAIDICNDRQDDYMLKILTKIKI